MAVLAVDVRSVAQTAARLDADDARPAAVSLEHDRSRHPARDRSSSRRRRRPAVGRPVPAAAYRSRGGGARDASARRLQPPLSRPCARRGGVRVPRDDHPYLNNDADALHERLLLDVAGTIAFLRARGFATVVLLGNSGGGSLFAFYLEEAAKPPAERLARAPSGDRVPLGEVEMPVADGLVLLAAHLGEGRYLLDHLDPSVVDEDHPTAVNPRLDMYDPANGYRPMEEGASRYSADFLAEYRAAQRARCERIDRRALAWCEEATWFRARLREPGLTPAERPFVARRALQRRYLLVYRTLADPRHLDLSLDPSERRPGSIFSFGRDPIAGNYGEGLARVMSARGWLSTWSGLRSNADLKRTLPSVTVQTQVICATADTDIHPSECRRAFEAVAARDKRHDELRGADHYLNPVGPAGARRADPRQRG